MGCACRDDSCDTGRCISGLCVDVVDDTEGTFGGTTGSSDPTAASSDTAGVCVPSLEFGAFTSISALAIGTTERYDMDRDGRLDVVGGRGVIVSADLDIVVFPGQAPGDGGHAGMFDGDGVADMAWGRGPEEGLVMLPGAGGDPVVTATPATYAFAATDIDGDGIDDVALSTGAGLTVWQGSAAGTFAELAHVTDDVTTWPTFVRMPAVQLVAGDDTFTRFSVYRFDGTDFAFASAFALFQAYFLESVDAFGDGREYLLAAQSITQLTTMSSAGLLYEQGNEWLGWMADLDGRTPVSAALGDVDDDGIGEIAVVLDSSSLALLCWTGDRFARCGERDDLPGVQVELLPGRVLAAGDDGVWIAELTASNVCR
ncbi:MAG: hypothetical protein IAG13_07590 [Deltaproteobacteria bacterium]|nr:hypothetical protein [Nannocystaceae bacterium]